MAPPAWNADLRSARAARPRSARHGADRRDGSLSRCNRAEGTFPDLCRPGRPAARRPRAFGPLCRPESSYCENAVPRVGRAPRWRRRLGTPTSGRHALRDRAAHGTAPTGGMVLSHGATGRRGRSRISVAEDDQRRVVHGPPARSAARSPATVKTQSRGSAERLDGAAGLERRPPVGTRCATAQRTARRRPAGWFSLSVQPGGGDAPGPPSPTTTSGASSTALRPAPPTGGRRSKPFSPFTTSGVCRRPRSSATATCDPPADPASATCTPRRTRYCDM